MALNSKIPSGPLDKKWEKHKFEMKLVNPANKRKYNVIVVGSGLAGGSAAATLAKIVPVVLIVLQLKVVSTLQRTTKTMETVFIDFFMIQLKVETLELVKQTFIG